jgi:capsular exopolysaccharide synthesis family protein
MDDETRLVPRDPGSIGTVEVVAASSRIPTIDLSPHEPHLYDYLLILRKHRWLILSFLLAVVTIVAVATFREKPVYVASATLEIGRENTNILPFPGVESYDFMIDLDNYIDTQSRILASETLALQTIRILGLNGDPEFAGASESEAIVSGSLKNQKLPPEIGAFLGSLAVRRIPGSRMLTVSFESTDPRAAARILNAHLDNYVEQTYKSRYEATADASKFLQSELDELSVKVRRSEDARIAYERANQIWLVGDNASSNVATQRLADLNKQLADAQSDSLKKQALYEFAKAGDVDAVPQIRDNNVLAGMRQRRADLSIQYSDALNQYGPNFPKVQRLQAQMKELDDQMLRERKGIVVQLENDYREAKQQEDLLSRALDAQKADANVMSQKMIEYNILKREAEANKTLYDSLQTKLKEGQIASGLKSSNIRIVDPALVPTAPARPAKTRNIMLAFLVGLVGGIGLALLREYLDNTVKTPDDVETLARLPSLAVVPTFSEGGVLTKRAGLLKSASSNGSEKRMELVAHHLPKSQMSEAFRALRTALLLSQAGHPPQVILVSSALPREGKTTAATNLAVTLAQLGDKTVVLDADLRKPGVGRLLSLETGKDAGLSSYLAGVSTLDLVIVPHPAIPNLAAIPTGPLPPNPADLLSSHKLAEAIAELRKKYKFIVIDSPPIMAATDAVILSVQADGVLLVVRSGETPKEAFTRTRDLLNSVKCHLLGVVLNAVNRSAPDYYYSYRYYPYSYGYGPQETRETIPGESASREQIPSADLDDSDKL